MAMLLSGKVFSINFFKSSNLPSTNFDGSLTVLWVLTCNIILSGHFFNSGFFNSSIIVHVIIVAPGKFLTLTFLSLFEILLSSTPDNTESRTMRVVFLPHFWRCSFELGDMRFFNLCKFLLLFLTEFNKLVLDCIYWSGFYIPILLYFFISMSFALRRIQCNISLFIIFGCCVISTLWLKTFFSCCISLDSLSMDIFAKNFTRFVWVFVHAIYGV